MQLTLSANQLSLDKKKGISQNSDDAVFYMLSELKSMGVKNMFKTLVNLRVDQLVIVFEDQTALALADVFKIISLLVRSKSKVMQLPDMSCKKVHFLSSIAALFRFVFSSFVARFKMRSIKKELKTLMASQSSRKEMKSINAGIYVNANMWFGVKAGGSIGHIAGVANSLASDFKCNLKYMSLENNACIVDTIDSINFKPLKTFTVPLEPNYYIFSRKAAKQLEAEVKKLSPDFIYQRMSICDYASVHVSKKYSIPLVIEYNGSEVWVANNWGKGLSDPTTALLAEDVTLKYADVVVTISDVLKDELIQRGVSPEKIVCYPNCINPNIFNPNIMSAQHKNDFRESLGFDVDDFIYTFLGTFGRWHGTDVLARAIRHLILNHEDFLASYKIKFLLVGDGCMLPEVKRIFSDIDFKKYVKFTGIVPQVDAPKYLAISSAFLSPHVENGDGTKFFGSPTKLFEYMAMNKPLIASSLEQIKDIHSNAIRADNLSEVDVMIKLSEKPTAVLCKPGCVNEIIESIIWLPQNNQTGFLLARNSYNLVIEKYTWKQHTKKILDKIRDFYG